MKRHTLSIAAGVIVWSLAALPLQATQVVYRTPKQLGQDAALVVDGHVSNVRSYWNESNTKIITEATVEVAGTHKGNAGGTVRVVQLGGVVGNVKMTVAGALSWRPGEEVLLFLEPATPGAYQVAGFSQGKYRIDRDPRSGKAFVEQVSGAGTELLVTPGAEVSASAPRKLSLDRFLDDVFGRK